MLLIKSICPMWTHQWLKKKWETPKRNAAKCYIMCTFQDVKPTQETAGSGLNRLYNVLCLLWNIHSGAPLPRIYSITNTKHWITYTHFFKTLKILMKWRIIQYFINVYTDWFQRNKCNILPRELITYEPSIIQWNYSSLFALNQKKKKSTKG